MTKSKFSQELCQERDLLLNLSSCALFMLSQTATLGDNVINSLMETV